MDECLTCAGAEANVKWNKAQLQAAVSEQFLAALCIPVVTTSKNLLHPNAHCQAAEAELRDRSLSFQERGVEEGEITGLDSCVWIFTVVSKSIIWGSRVKDEWKAGSLPSA